MCHYHLAEDQIAYQKCSSGGRAGSLVFGKSLVQIQAPPDGISMCP